MDSHLLQPDGIVNYHKAMVGILCNHHPGFRIFHFNARSLNGGNLDYFRYVFEQSLADIICVSETWFKYLLPDSMYSLKGFQLFRNDRKGRRGGGVAVYVKDSYDASVISQSDNTMVEYINIAVRSNTFSMSISCVYNPRREHSLDPFFADLNCRLIDFNYFFVCGDFNVDILRSNSFTCTLKDRIASAGLYIINNSTPTRYCNDALPSLIDLFLVSSLNELIKFDQTSFVSDHDLMFCSLKLPFVYAESLSFFTYRDFNRVNISSLAHDLAGVSWKDCWYIESVDDKLTWFMDVVQPIFENNVPLKTARVSSNSCPWFTDEVLSAIKVKNKLHSKWKASPSTSNWSCYVNARNLSNSLIKRSKRNYFASQLDASFSAKQLWNNMRKLKIVPQIDEKCTLSPDQLNSFFANVVNTSRPIVINHACSVEKPFQFVSVSDVDIGATILNISSNAVGVDGIPIKFLKLALPFILPTITHIINHCLTSSVFPNIWKVATITPIPKKLNAAECNDYRPISILPSLAKVCERIMAQQITDYISDRDLLSPLQSGFRKGHSCSTAMIKIIEDIRQPYDRNDITLLCLLDFSKAFDSVNHDLLCSKLVRYFHFSNTSCNLIANYLSNRKQRVRVGDNFSDLVDVNVGVPQGSTLGPLLFSLFINDLLDVCKYATMHAFADDIQLYISGAFANATAITEQLNHDLFLISTWSGENGISLNTAKSKIMPIFNKKINTSMLSTITLGNDMLEFVNVAKNLGFYINSTLTCNDHVKALVCKVYCILRMLRNTGNYTPVNIKRNLVMQLIVPHFTYFCLVFSKLDSVSLNQITVLFNNVTRYVYSLRKFDHISAYSKAILGVHIHDYLKMRNLIFLDGLLRSRIPRYLFDKIHMCQSVRTAQIIQPRYNHLNVSRFFFINAVRLWNSLPISLRLCSSGSAFRSLVYAHYAKNN